MLQTFTKHQLEMELGKYKKNPGKFTIGFVSEVQTIILAYKIASKTANKNARISLNFLAFFFKFIFFALFVYTFRIKV